VEGESGVQQTSIDAFYRITPDELRGLQAEVFRVIKNEGPVCDRIGALRSTHPKTGDPMVINVWVPRRNELMHMELVRFAGLDEDPGTGAMVKHWEVWE